MKSFIRNLPAPVEFFIVVSLWLDPLLLGGCFMLPKFLQTGVWDFSNAHLMSLFQIMALAALIWIGNIRGWPLSTFGTKISWKGTGGGILLAGVSYAVLHSLWTIGAAIFHSEHPMIGTSLAIPVIVSTTIINSVFEEVVEAGYFIHTFSRFGMWPAILVSALLRMLYHVPLGMDGLLGIFTAGLIFAFVYWRWRQLWPLVLAHSLMNFYSYYIHHAA